MAQQTNITAVQWLYNKMYEHRGNITIEEYEQAKQMEKKHIITANEDSSTNESGEFLTGEQYYNKMYGNKSDDHTEQHLEMVSSKTEISDDDIKHKIKKEYSYLNYQDRHCMEEGAKWYREQLKKR